jgi:trk system potassium uptake protein TrkA
VKGARAEVYVVVVGGGKVGFYLTRTMLAKGHEVTLIERRPNRAEVLRQTLGDVVLVGDGTRPSVLDAAGLSRAEVLAAVTGDDAVNLLAAVEAQRRFGVRRTVARLSDPRNERLFRRAGVDDTVSSSAILAELVEREVSAERVRTVLTFPHAGTSIVELAVGPDSPARGRAVRDVAWPTGVLLIAAVRGGDVLVPSGATVLEAGDRLLVIARPEAADALADL